ncbi:MAG TPA: DNA polymerase III subunit delta [Acidimicrobiales bacterium]|nr:DNA polymerase III subunit delta [Acidimicrobiales bacterium]
MAPAFFPVYLVRGEDPSLLSQGLSSLLNELAGNDPLGIEHLPPEADLAVALEALSTPSLLGDRRVVVVREAGRFDAAAVEPLLEYLGEPSEGSVLVLIAGGGQTNRRLLDAVRKRGHILETAVPQKSKEKTQWIADQIAAGPVRLVPGATRKLVAHLGEDLGRLETLLAGLAAAYGEGATIGEDELDPFLGEAGGVAPWDLTDAIDRGDTAGAVGALHRMLDGGQRHPMAVLSTLSRHVLALVRLDGAGARSDAEAAALIGTAPFPARKALAQSRKLGSDAISRAVRLVAQADLDLRGTSEWPSVLVLEVLVARLSRLG